ncbi:MAG TPA: alpha/beta fold hydrolase [Gaiellaceae bacterium]|nr:alpha/beta fold hydrolase [Gaiellaceae bacterium]
MSPPILLLHAFPLDARMWNALVDVLDRAGYETVVPNLPGREPDNELSSWARRLLEVLPGSFIPVGCSMGGYLQFELWRQASDRIPAVVFIDSRAGADTPEGRQGRDDTIRLLRDEGFEAFWPLQAPKLFGPSAEPDVVERARRIASEQPIENLVATLEALRDRPDSRKTASSVNVPALVVVGDHDQLTPPGEAEELAGLLPTARLVVLPGAGHLTPLERPAELNEEIFLFLNGLGLDKDARS